MNNFEKQLEDYKKETHIEPREEKIGDHPEIKGSFFPGGGGENIVLL